MWVLLQDNAVRVGTEATVLRSCSLPLTRGNTTPDADSRIKGLSYRKDTLTENIKWRDTPSFNTRLALMKESIQTLTLSVRSFGATGKNKQVYYS